MAEPWHEVIEILSDSDDDQEAANTPPSDSMEDDEWIIAYRAAGMPLAVDPTEAHEGADVSSERTQEALTEDDFLTKVLEVYPDIAHEHVRQLHRDAVQKGEKTDVSWCEVIIVRILDDGLYPKERDRRRDLKRKRQPSPAPEDIVTTIWGDGHYEVGSKLYTLYATEILANEFSYVPKKFIGDTLKREITLYHAHVALEELQQKDHTPYTKVRKARHHQELSPNMPNLFKELEAAKKKIKGDTDKRLKAEKERKAEEENERVSRVEGNIAECGCCFTEYPTNRMTFCNGTETDIHFFCHECAQSYVKAEIGQGKCRPKCMDTSGCPAIFARAQLQNFLDEKTFEVLERFQQQEDLRLAGLDDMEECPFCDFKMICLPKEVDREFRCQHPDCKIVSCRLCRMETHVPLTCEQASKDKKVDVRHLVEEAMTAALVRECNKCKNKFVKEFGCNKMTCPTCGNVQCYICSKNTRSYEHFQDKPEKCPLYDNTDERHDDEVKKAEAAALEQIKKDHPELQNEDLKIEVSDAVKQVEKQRIQNGAARVPVNYAIPQQAHLVGQFAIPPVAGRPLHNVGAPHAGVPVAAAPPP
ncbi:uncharacterized protein K452DRAFT_315676 [Aplosporella prunicola CBS 121167]|uniref:RING-type domain-containing protein n=1 Tax=Aplosporella prunicola CBS 121167 TaxID=1176127 RepID=A0A6A6BMR8_9PEZI|nr:uncharacterized protein K452DRAFT_315676 [Aplosporella prunicola CBS 121167]KAF2145429.1 hypothetical protein K452DRAFT_315676 [Aplosporella prunicola CBS 121167]